MSDLQIPLEYTEIIDGAEWYSLSHTMGWLKGVDYPVQINPYKRRCSSCNIRYYKTENQKGKPRAYVNIEGLREIVERTRSIELKTKRLIGVKSGVTSSEKVFGDILFGFFSSFGIDIKPQFKVEGFMVDYLVGDEVAVEFDEFTHDSYCQKKEDYRESRITANGYKIVRVKDSLCYGEALALVFNELKNKDKL